MITTTAICNQSFQVLQVLPVPSQHTGTLSFVMPGATPVHYAKKSCPASCHDEIIWHHGRIYP